MTRSKRYTLVVNTCDAYEDTWDPLFTLFRRYWRELDAPVVLNTETKSYQHDGFEIVCPQLYRGEPNPAGVPWSKRLRETLEQTVATELVMLYLDDYYLTRPVQSERLEICLQMMERDKRIASFALFSCPPPFTPLQEYPWIVKRIKKLQWHGYLFNLQAGLWRTKRLLDFLRDHESPWYFERWGSLRALRYPDDFYGVVPVDGRESIFDYSPSMQGLSKGMWLPETPELFEAEGIQIDVSKRGVMPRDWQAPPVTRNWFKTAWNISRSLRP
jgi:hypothetical protein